MNPKNPILESLLNTPLKVVNVGLTGFAEDLEKQQVAVVHVDWSPSHQADPKLAGLLSKLGS